MARVEISETVLAGSPVRGVAASVQVNVRGGGAATVYAAETGGSTLSNPLTADSFGRIEGWLPVGSYDLVVTAAGFTSYTQPFEAASGVAGGGVPLVDPADVASVIGAAVFNNALKSWYGASYNVGDVPDSFGFSGTPTTTPATTITSGVTFPLLNATVPVADCAQLNANGGSFTLGGKRVAYLGRSASSGAGNATGCYSLASDTGTVASGTALGNTATGYFPLMIYKRFGYDGRPNVGSTQAFGVVASYKSPTLDDSAEAGSFVTVMADPGVATTQHKPVTGGEMTAVTLGNWTLPDGYTAPLCGGGVRTGISAGDNVENVIGLKISDTSTGGWIRAYDGVYQTATTYRVFTTLAGVVTLPQATIAVTSGAAMPPATAADPVTVLIGPNVDGVGGQAITYTGISGNNLTGCTGGTGATGAADNVTNSARAINVVDRIIGQTGIALGASGWSGGIAATLKGGTDSVKSMLSIVGPTNTEVAGGLTPFRVNAGVGQTKQNIQVFDTAGTNRFSVAASCAVALNGVPIQVQTSGATNGSFGQDGYVQTGTSVARGGSNALGAKINSGSGAPAHSAALGDRFQRTDTPSTANQREYVCTTAGSATTGAWTGIA